MRRVHWADFSSFPFSSSALIFIIVELLHTAALGTEEVAHQVLKKSKINSTTKFPHIHVRRQEPEGGC